MVQKERREDDAHAPIWEREAERIPCDRGAPRGEPRVRDFAIDAEKVNAHPLNRRRLDQVPPHVSGAAPQIENREPDPGSAEGRKKREEAAAHERTAAEPAVHPFDVGEARLGLASRDVVGVEELRLGTPLRNPEAHRSQRARPLRRTSAEFLEPKAIPLQSANSTSAARAAFGT
jgi:hypothetical protein